MSLGLRARLLAAIAAFAIAVGGVLPVVPAFADEPTTTPTSAPTEEPIAVPTGEPSAEPTSEPTEPTAEPTAAPTATPTATPSPTPSAAAATTISLVGTFTRYSTEDRVLGDEPGAEPADDGIVLFTVPGSGFLRVDISQLASAIAAGSATVRFAVPAGLALSSDSATAFQQLASYSSTTAPIVALSVLPGRVSSRSTPMVNQSPNTPAVHEVYAVLVSPSNGTRGLDQNVTSVAATVAHTNDYWNQQSDGSVQFELAGTTAWYPSANSCKTDAGSTALWNEAAAKAKTQLGYTAGRNVHLVLFFAGSTNCGSSIGLGSIGWSPNEGGVAWVIGTDADEMSEATLSHELGHNLSLGHAQWVHCIGNAPTFLSANIDSQACATHPYGDVVDVMGYGMNGKSGGALSSPGGIRSGIWPASAYVEAPAGTPTTYTLNAVSQNTGLRSIVIEDPYLGDRFFVEFRNFTDEDAQYSGIGCNQNLFFTANACAATAPGVRVLKLDGNPYGFLAFPGDDTLLLGRTSGTNQTGVLNYTAGQTFYSRSTPEDSTVKVEVLSISGNTASVRVTRGALDNVYADFVNIVPTLTSDGRTRVGDTWTAMLGAGWGATTYSFQWYRNGSPIAEATDHNYTLTPLDLGSYISVSATGAASGFTSKTRYDPDDGTGYGPIVLGLYGAEQPGTVAIDNSTTPLEAVEAEWPSGTTYAYQWYRGATGSTATTAIAGGTAPSYTPTAADAGQFLRVRLTATVPGYIAVARYSDATNYSLTAASGAVTISGTLAVDELLTAVNGISYSSFEGPVTPNSFNYQWLRNGVAIVGAVSSTYTPVAADYNTKLSVRVVATAPGYAQHTATSAQTTAIAAGAIGGSGDLPTMEKVHDGNPGGVWTLTATLPVGSITETGVAYAYQWFRDATAIAGATAVTYRPVAADYGYDLSVRVTVTKLNFATRILTALPVDYSVYADPGALTIDSDGTPAVGETLGAGFVTYYNAIGAVSPVQSWQWYRNGVAIAGATGTTYELGSADYNTVITFRVTSKVTGFLGLTVTSVATPKIAKGVLEGALDVPTVAHAGLKLTATPVPGSITTVGVAYAYQWFRGATAIAGATKVDYTLVPADFGALIQVKATVTKLNFATVVLPSAPVNYSVMPSVSVPVIVGELRVGAPITVVDRTYSVIDPGAVVETYQWYRAGVAIPAPLGTVGTYTVVAADLGKALTVRVTASQTGFLPAIGTSAATQAVGTNTLDGWNDQESVTVAVTGPATLTATGTGITGPTPLTVAYQWYRGNVAVAGSTKNTYALTAADFGQEVWVRATTSKATYTTIVKTSPRVDYSIQGAAPTITSSTGPWAAGAEVAVGPMSYTTKDGPLTPTTVAYQWLRNGVAIPGATNFYYGTGSADYNTKLTVRITSSEPGYVARIVTTAATPTLAKGTIEGTLGAPTVSASSTGLLSIGISGGTITTPAAVLTYQWYRNAGAIAGATKATYQLASADYGTSVSVRITATKLNYTSAPLAPSDLVNYSVVGTVLTISGTGKIDEALTASTPTYQAFGSPVTPTITYQWLRGTVAIAGATGAEYRPQPADFGLKLSVRVTAVAPGTIASVSTATSAVAVTAGVWQGSFAAPDVTVSPTGLLTSAVPSGAITTPGAPLTYQWYRNTSTLIAGATKATYQLTAADYGATVWVRVTATKPRLDTPTRVLESDKINYSVTRDTNVTITGTAAVGETLGVTTTTYNGASVTPTVTYQWLRNSAVIAGATASTYVIASADLGSKFTVRVTAASPAHVASVYTTLVATALVAKGVLGEDLSVKPDVVASASAVLTASLPAGAVTAPAVTLAYQWYRNAAPIAGATKATFALTAADAGKTVFVRITASKVNVVPASAFFTSDPVDYTLVADSAAAISETTGVSVTTKLWYLDTVAYAHLGSPITPTVSYQWLRNGVAIAGATGPEYYTQGADYNTKISLRVTAAEPGLIPSVLTTAATNALAKGAKVQVDSSLAPTVSASSTGVLSVSIPNGAVQTPGTTLIYQWFRNGAAIAGATKATFALTALDFRKTVFVRVTAGMPNVVLSFALADSAPVDYSVVPGDDVIGISGTLEVDGLLTAAVPGYVTDGGDPVSPTFSYQWLRNNVAIAGATASTYRAVAADYNTKLSARVTAAVPGLISSVLTSAQTTAIAKGQVVASGTPVVTLSPARVLTATLAPGTVTTTGTTLSYQWYRDGVVVAGATAATYTIAAADSNKNFKVRVSVNKLNLTSANLDSAAVNYSMTADLHPPLDSSTPLIGVALALVAPDYTSSTGDLLNPALTYQWLRAGVAIVGATGPSYTPILADLGKALSLRVAATLAGKLALTTTSATTQPVALGTFEFYSGPVITGSWPSVLTAALPDGSITEPGVTLAYQWYRGETPIPGATAATYVLSPTLDLGVLTKVRVTASKSGYASVLPRFSVQRGYTIETSGLVVLSESAPSIGAVVSVSALPDFTKDSSLWSPASGNLAYQWYLNGVAVGGAAGIGATYTVVPGNAGKTLSLRVTAKAPGYLPATAVSAGAVIPLS